MTKNATIVKRIATLLCMVVLILTMFDLAVFADEATTTASQNGADGQSAGTESATGENGTD